MPHVWLPLLSFIHLCLQSPGGRSPCLWLTPRVAIFLPVLPPPIPYLMLIGHPLFIDMGWMLPHSAQEILSILVPFTLFRFSNIPFTQVRIFNSLYQNSQKFIFEKTVGWSRAHFCGRVLACPGRGTSSRGGTSKILYSLEPGYFTISQFSSSSVTHSCPLWRAESLC